jgi:predicted metal-dependent HD superfamily phosphohydrolase
MIRATAHSAAGEVDADTAVLLDADLAILSAEERRYARYAADVRREYTWVDEPAYRAGRTKVLEGFLARSRIYRTERMHAAAEAAARANLRAEVERLPAGPLP